MSSKTKEVFTLNFSLTTDGDFCLPLIPQDVKYDGDESYCLTKEFKRVEDAIAYCDNILMQSFRFLYCSSKSSQEYFINKLTANLKGFIDNLKAGFDDYEGKCLISGNQEGEITLTSSLPSYRVYYRFTASEWEIVDKAEELGLNYSYTKEVFIQACKDFIKSKEETRNGGTKV